MRYLNLSLNEAEKLSLRDFSYRMHVQALKQIDKEHDIAMAAWYNKIVKATKDKKGTPKFEKFEEFFDYKKRIEQLSYKENKIQDDKLKTLLLQANK